MSNGNFNFGFERLKGRENFSEWKVGARAYLTSKGYFDSCTVKLATDANAAAKSADKKALAELTLLLSSSLYSYVEEAKEAKEAWDTLITMFEDKGAVRKVSLLKQWISLKSEECTSIHDYVNKNVTIRAKVKNAGFDISEEIAGCILLCGLSEEYNPLVMSMEAKADITLDSVKNLLLQSIDINRQSENAMAVKKFGKNAKNNGKKNKNVKCYECEGSHYRNKCPKLKNGKNEKSDIVLFTYLDLENDDNSEHSESVSVDSAMCKDISLLKSDNSDISENSYIVSEDAVSSSVLVAKSENDNEWFVDSGATKHMTHVDCEMLNVKDPPIKHVKAANGEKMNIVRTGDIKCNINNRSVFVLSDVQYIPKLCVNLLSVSQMVRNGCQVTFNADGCKIYSSDMELLAEGKMVNGMFTIQIRFNESACMVRAIKNADIALWHRRLAHLNFSTLKSMFNLKVQPDTKCIVCTKAKHARAPFNDTGTRASGLLELIHTDVCGPLPVMSMGGGKLFLTFIDDYSRMLHVFILRSKGEVFSKFVLYKKQVENELNLKIKAVRSDNGTEFVNRNFCEFFEKHGIRHEKSTPYSPQQNGLAERMNRTIIEKVRCMLIDSKLTKNFWAEAVCAAVDIINNVSSNVTPQEKWSGKKSNYADFKVFGCRAMVWQPNVKRSKLDEKSHEYIYLRRADDAKAFRLYDINQRKIIISRDVVFLEKEDRVIDANNFNNNSHVYIQDENDGGRFEEIVEQESDQVSPEAVAPIVSGESNANESTGANDANESAAAGEHQNDESNNVSVRNENADDSEILTDDEPENDSTNATFESTSTSLDETSIDAGAQANAPDDPNFRTRARVDTTADRPVTRGFRNLLNLHVAFSVFHEPDTYQEALNSDDSMQWKVAMREEYDSLMKNDTWILVERPRNVQIVDNRWVFKIKQESKCAPLRYKARLVARGFTQQYGVNYFETFSPVVRFTSIRAILAIAAQRKMELRQFDVKTAFLNGDLSDIVYMQQPTGFDDKSGRICMLKKSLYGLKQSSRCWNRKFTEFIKLFGFEKSKFDPCVFVSRQNNILTILAIHVDDGLIASESVADIKSVLAHLNKHFEVKEMEIGCFLGLEINRNADGSIFVHQSMYAEKVLKRFNFDNCHGISTPSDPNQPLHDFIESEPSNFAYRNLIGSLMYLAIGTRADIAHAVSVASRFLEKPTVVHERAAKRILRYIKKTLNHGIFYTQDRGGIKAYSDADFAGDTSTRKSTSGSVVFFGSNMVSWSSERQQSVSLSTTESEYIAASQCAKELVWLKNLVCEILDETSIETILYMDNQSAIRLVKNPEFHKRTKHIDIRYHFIREKFEENFFDLEYVATQDMIADVFTKALPAAKFNELISKLGIREN